VIGAKDENRLCLESEATCYAGRDVVVQRAVHAGEEVKLFTEIQDVHCESRESDEKNDKKNRFPFLE
jgi:hypothetical protein